MVGRDAGGAGNSWLRSSPTDLIMILLPLLVAVCWVAMGVVIATM
ncbi:hypothetical protein [Streptomyces chattanoogensis]|nr:hypothetical protein [Streptomyces chattanoogensis]